jgi:trehalose synthase
MEPLQQVSVAARELAPLAALYDEGELSRVRRAAAVLERALRGGAVWNINSTARGGGVAEMLSSLVAYAQGAGIDCRWAVIRGEDRFFRLTKRLHNALHGVPAGGCEFLDTDRREYEEVCQRNAAALLSVTGPRDVVVLHDPQTLGIAPFLSERGIRAIWRCHVGTDTPNRASRAAHQFLAPYLRSVSLCVFSRAAYVPEGISAPVRIVVPTIDPLCPKNQDLSPEAANAILVQVGLMAGTPSERGPEIRSSDGALCRVEHCVDTIRLGHPCHEEQPYVVQVSRWDRLKDHLGVMRGFRRYIEAGGDARLILAGPTVHAVADDPEGAEIFDEVLVEYRALPHAVRARIELANLPMANADENAIIVNALQRRATVVVQKSLREGFGLTVTEAMWKAKPVIASRVGGIQDQIEHAVSGVLLDDPYDERAFADALFDVLSNPGYAERLGRAARERVRSRFLSLSSLYRYAEILGKGQASLALPGS